MSASPPPGSLGGRRSPAAVPGYLAPAPTAQQGRRYTPDPPRTEEIIAVIRCCATGCTATARGLIVVLWRAGLRIQEALNLTELDLDPRRGSVLVRRGKRAASARSAWTTGASSSSSRGCERQTMPVGPLFCVISGRARGRDARVRLLAESNRFGETRANPKRWNNRDRSSGPKRSCHR
jgi:integrase